MSRKNVLGAMFGAVAGYCLGGYLEVEYMVNCQTLSILLGTVLGFLAGGNNGGRKPGPNY